MKTTFAWLLLTGFAIQLSGCVRDPGVSQEDHDFFYSGWMRPEQGANRRLYGTDSAPGAQRPGLKQTDLHAQ